TRSIAGGSSAGRARAGLYHRDAANRAGRRLAIVMRRLGSGGTQYGASLAAPDSMAGAAASATALGASFRRRQPSFVAQYNGAGGRLAGTVRRRHPRLGRYESDNRGRSGQNT